MILIFTTRIVLNALVSGTVYASETHDIAAQVTSKLQELICFIQENTCCVLLLREDFKESCSNFYTVIAVGKH